MNRTDFFNIITVNGNKEYDYLYNSLSGFVMNYPISYYQITESDVMRPDLISYKIYGTVDYWWLILFVNDIQDPLNDIKSGTIIKIPSILDIYAFAKKYSFR
jgi:Base plate wedge protein 53